MERVTGIGGFFFRARDPKALAKWYTDNLGVSLTPTSHGDAPWEQEAGPTVFQPFPEDTDYFGNPAKAWMLNLRVRDLHAMIAQLRNAGVETGPVQEDVIGRFSRVHDPEGNPIELWEPADPQKSS